MRQILSTAITALVVAALTAVSVGALAQPGPAQEGGVTQSGTNADRVDGRHAVGFTNKRGLRANKLVATNKGGWLPSNIVQPYWGYIKNKPGILADHQIGWDEVQGKPGILADQQIGWNEVAGKPAGFADNVDNAGVTGVTVVTHAASRVLAGNTNLNYYQLNCPTGAATGGGYLNLAASTRVLGAFPFEDYYQVQLQNTVTQTDAFTLFVTCLTTEGGGAVAARVTKAAKAARPGK